MVVSRQLCRLLPFYHLNSKLRLFFTISIDDTKPYGKATSIANGAGHLTGTGNCNLNADELQYLISLALNAGYVAC